MEPLSAELKAGTTWWRGHSLIYPGEEFNPTRSVTRFTPIFAPGRRSRHLPYAYVGENEDVAIAESVLHDVSGDSPSAIIPAAKLEAMALSELRLHRSLTLIDLTGLGLKRINRTLEELIASPPSDYPRTAAVAQELLNAVPEAEGILYPSRQFGAGKCVIVYRRGRKVSPFERIQSLSMAAGPGRELVDLACDKAGVTVVD